MTTIVSAADALRTLRDLDTTPHQIVSCYVRCGGAERPRRACAVEVRQALAAAADGAAVAALSHDDRMTLRRDLARVLALVRDGRRLPATPGAVIFACEALGLLDVVPLPRVHRTRVVTGPRPALAELVAAEQEFGRVLVVLADRGRARLFEVTAFDVTELPALHPVTTRGGKYHSDRHGAPGWGERDFHDRIREEAHRRYALVVDALRAQLAERPAQGLVLAGPLKETAALRRFLPVALAAQVLGAAGLNPTSATPAEVRAAALAVHAEAERRRVRRLVTRMRAQAGAGWAVNGTRAVLAALARGQVRTLLLGAGARLPGYRCTASGRLVLAATDCAGDGEARSEPDLLEAVLTEALRQRVEVVTVEEPAAEAAMDVMAALLRFR